MIAAFVLAACGEDHGHPSADPASGDTGASGGIEDTNIESCNGVDDDDDGDVDESGCPSPVFEYDGHAYMFCPRLRTWSESRRDCAAFEYELVTVDSPGENEFLSGTAQVVGWIASWWIGLSDISGEGQFRWETGAPVSWSNWGWGQPDDLLGEDCVEMVVGGGWNDLECLAWRFYVCES